MSDHTLIALSREVAVLTHERDRLQQENETLKQELQAAIDELREILALILAEPYGCPWCDSGKLRNPAKSHGESCGFAKAATMLANKEPRDKRSEQIAEQLAAYAALRQDAQKLVDALSQPPRRDGRRFVSCDLELASLRAALQGTGPT